MIGHQRDILATLGIDIWVPKDAVCQNLPVHAIWRDQAVVEEYSTVIRVEQNNLAIPIISQVVSVSIEPLERLKSEEKPAALSAVKETQPDIVLPIVESIPLAPFQLQALGLQHCIIVADVTEMSAEQQQLWQNIQQAFQSEFYELQWPFPFLNFQDGRGAESYIKGFVDAIALEKKIIVLGSSSYMKDIEKIDCSSLQEMLEDSVLKKQLWQKIFEFKKNMDLK